MATIDLFAAVWKVHWDTSKDQSLLEKGTSLTDALIQAHTFMLAAANRMKATKPVFVFTAPEYYWIQDGLYSLYSESEKNTIYSALKSTSDQFKDVVIFPGTVNWQVPKDQHAGPLPSEIKTKDFVGYNTAPVYADGKLLLDYYKKFNDGELDKRNTAAFGAGPQNGVQHFSSKGLKFGLDVCGDLNKGQLSLTLGNKMVDVMVVISGTMSHDFSDARINTVPVRDGGAFVHCDNRGTEEKNGVWVLNRGKGWHGSANSDITLAFDDLDKKIRIIGFDPSGKSIVGNNLPVSVIGGFGAAPNLSAIVGKKSANYVYEFEFKIPGSGRSQKVAIKRLPNADYSVKLTRNLSTTKTVTVKPTYADGAGLRTTGNGNVSKIGKLLPNLNGKDLNCYYLPIKV